MTPPSFDGYTRHRGAALAVLLLCFACRARAVPETNLAREMLAEACRNGGLVIHVGCYNGKLTAALHAGGKNIVHGLDMDADSIRGAREHIRSLGIYGPVSVDLWNGKTLPYADNVANLVVASGKLQVASGEVERVLAPRGVLLAPRSLTTDHRSLITEASRLKGWTKLVKPVPDVVDDWTHYMYDASGNAVSHDTVVAPPRRVQWIAGPRHARSHEHTPTLNALVSSGGRIFYIVDESSIETIRESPKWHVVARDAYNGGVLWKRPFAPWFPHILNWGAHPPSIQRRLVAADDRVYVTLGLHAPASALDAATGRTLKVYAGTEGAEELAFHNGVLLIALRNVTDRRKGELTKWAGLSKQDNSPLCKRETAEPLLKEFRDAENKAGKKILALDATTARVLWKKEGADAGGLKAMSLSAIGQRAVYQKGNLLSCLELRTGRVLWSSQAPPLRTLCGSHLICSDGKTLKALSIESGEARWAEPSTLCSIRDAFIIGETLWMGGFKAFQGRTTGKRGPPWGPCFATLRDLATGRILRRVEPENPGHHHRCWRDKATDRYILAGRRGVEFIDVESGEHLWHNWVRGVCRYGVMPANGLLYAPPHACGCYIAAKLTGFYALAGTESRSPRVEEAKRLEKGPAYDLPIRHSAIGIRHSDAWPTYRHDARRSGCTTASVPAKLKPVWTAGIGGKLTAPVVAGGKVFAATVDRHAVVAVDAGSGKESWVFTAGARVDSPPTVHGNRVLFGSRDGYVYSLRASDGALEWRLRVAMDERRIPVYGQLEAASPAHGSILVRDGTAYATAGRSSYLDGGIDLYRLEANTGKVLSRTPIYSPDPKTGRQPDQYGPCHMPGALGEILSSDEKYVYLRDMVFSPEGARQNGGNPHLFTMTGFLDDTWAHRSYWIYGRKCTMRTGCSGVEKNLVHGRLLVTDGTTVYGYGRADVHWSNALRDGPYRLFARKHGAAGTAWTKQVPVTVRAMLLADGKLFVAGQDRTGNGKLMAFPADGGKRLGECALEAAPVFDGMAAVAGKLFISLENGQLVCMGGE